MGPHVAAGGMTPRHCGTQGYIFLLWRRQKRAGRSQRSTKVDDSVSDDRDLLKEFMQEHQDGLAMAEEELVWCAPPW